jgi:hypothetical protein
MGREQIGNGYYRLNTSVQSAAAPAQAAHAQRVHSAFQSAFQAPSDQLPRVVLAPQPVSVPHTIVQSPSPLSFKK